jgi:hypothetical protein
VTGLSRLVPIVYEHSCDGLVLAEQELARLTALHAAYASQPNITVLWQGYVDQKAEVVATHRLVVERLRDVLRNEMQAKADAAAARI